MDREIIKYAIDRVAEVQTKTPEAARFRHRMLALPVVLLREEGGLSWEAIGAELGIGQSTANKIYFSTVVGTP